MGESRDIAFLKRIVMATGPDGKMNPEVTNAAVDADKSGEPPPACVCGRGKWYSKIEKIRGAVAEDGSSRVLPMSCEIWICDACERERSMPEHPAQPLADAYVRRLNDGLRLTSPEMIAAAFREVFGRECDDDSEADSRFIISAFRLVGK